MKCTLFDGAWTLYYLSCCMLLDVMANGKESLGEAGVATAGDEYCKCLSNMAQVQPPVSLRRGSVDPMSLWTLLCGHACMHACCTPAWHCVDDGPVAGCVMQHLETCGCWGEVRRHEDGVMHGVMQACIDSARMAKDAPRGDRLIQTHAREQLVSAVATATAALGCSNIESLAGLAVKSRNRVKEALSMLADDTQSEPAKQASKNIDAYVSERERQATPAS